MLILFIIFNLFSKPFVSSFIEFNLPNNWECEPFNKDWTCQTMNPESKKDAIIVLTYRLSNPEDNLIKFLKYLEKPRIIKIEGNNLLSKPLYSKFKNIMGQEWVDSVHENSEILNYTSRYLATLKNGRSILIAFTVKKNKYNEYMPQLYNMIETLKLRQGLAPRPIKGDLKGLVGNFSKDMFKKVNRKHKELKMVDIQNEKEDNVLLYSIIAGSLFFVLVLIILIKKRRKNRDKNIGRIS